MSTRSFVKALYDYHSSEPGDLTFNAGTIIEVVDHIDDNWINGKLDGKVGLLPTNFVEPTSVSNNTEEQTVVARETYIGGEDGVLTFFIGDVITFLGYVDDYWCQGSFAGEVGLFPAHTVDGLEDLSASQNPVAVSMETSPNVSTQQEPSLSETPKISLDEPCAKSLFEFQGYSDTELSFPAGQMIKLTNDVDADWFEGIYDNKTGIFPKRFVNVLTPLITEKPEATTKEDPVPFAVAAYPFVGETRHELSFREGDVIYLHSWVSPEWIEGECDGVTGIFPSSFVQIQVELPQEIQDSSGYEWEKRNGYEEALLEPEKESSFKVGDMATAIYSFATNTEGDLPLEVGDLISIERIVDDEWLQGRKNGVQVGLCPAVFLELQSNVSKPDNTTQEYTNNSVTSSLESVENLPSKSGIVLEKLDYPQAKKTTANLDVSVEIQHTSASQISPKATNLPQTHFELPDTPRLGMAKPSITAHQSEPVTYVEESECIKPMSGKPPLGPKPILAPKPTICPKPDFLKKPTHKSVRPHKPVSSKQVSSKPVLLIHTNDKVTNVPNVTSMQHRKEVATGRQMTHGPKAAYNASIKKKHEITQEKPQARQNKPSTVSSSGWVTFEEQQPSKPSFKQSSNGQISPSLSTRNEKPGKHTMSYKTLLDKSLDEDLPSPLQPQGPPRHPPPNPPPRVDLLKDKSVSDDILSHKLVEQAEAFEMTSHSRSSPSLNELREARSKNLRPVPVKRTKLRPLSYNDSDTDTGGMNFENGFPILDDLDEEIIRLQNELEKETKVLSGVEVLVQMVNKDTPKREELQSKKAITERKIDELKRQLKKIEDQKKRLVKLLAGYSSQAEIQLKTKQLEESIKENINTKNDLQSLLSENEDTETRSELQENILFCEKAITNLQAELKSLMDILDQLEGDLQSISLEKEKDVTLRKKVINEILETEKSFGRDLNLCIDHYMKQLIEWKVDSIDYDVLFGNMPDIASLSSKLLERLKSATCDVDINDQIIGSCFVDFSDEITAIYGSYCRNHDEAIAFLEKSANDEEIQQYFRKCLESIREHSSCWDLASFLIKPVQRILKYPLLLNELLKNTPDDHPDKTGLIKAIEVMTTAANDVNEFKRRKDLVQKYQKVEESGLSTKFQKFTWHSVVKKSTRFNQRITQFTGLVSQTVDEKFNAKERTFYQIEKSVKNFLKNVTQYFEQFEEVQASQMQTAENILDYHQPDTVSKEIQEFYDAQKYIGGDLVSDLKRELDEDVLSPLDSIMLLFEGPRRLIQKRHDKCLDYDSWTNKIEKIKDREKLKLAKEELEFAKKNYEALNTQLLDELPVFNDKALLFFQACIRNFANVHKSFFVNALDQFSPSVQLSAVHPEGSDIVSDFLSSGNLATHEVFQLTFTPKKNLLLPRPGQPMLSPRSGRLSPSPDDKLKPTGSLKRSHSEVRRKLSPSTSASDGLIRSQTVSATDRSVLKKKTTMRRTSSSSAVTLDVPKIMPYVVKYMFLAEGPTELSVNKGDVVSVVNFHDNIGNTEWWKVEHGGKSGYVPAIYLVPQAGTNGTIFSTNS